MAEVAIGADLCTIEEAKDFMEEVPEKQPFMATSCCPAWSVMAKKLFPEHGRLHLHGHDPDGADRPPAEEGEARLHASCFIGPCAAKKLEASRRSVRSDVDFVLTFEELMGMFEAKDSRLCRPCRTTPRMPATTPRADGRGFAAVRRCGPGCGQCHQEDGPGPRGQGDEPPRACADCKKMLMMAKAGKYNGYLLEGMACPGGCIAGAGTLADPAKSAMMLNKYKNEAAMKVATETPYQDSLDLLKY